MKKMILTMIKDIDFSESLIYDIKQCIDNYLSTEVGIYLDECTDESKKDILNEFIKQFKESEGI